MLKTKNKVVNVHLPVYKERQFRKRNKVIVKLNGVSDNLTAQTDEAVLLEYQGVNLRKCFTIIFRNKPEAEFLSVENS